MNPFKLPYELARGATCAVLDGIVKLIPIDPMAGFDHDYDTAIGDDHFAPEPEPEPFAEGYAVVPVPRVVDALGVDEQDAQWYSSAGTYWKWENDRWWHSGGADGAYGVWVATPYTYRPDATGPFVEVVPTSPVDWYGWAVPAILEVLSEHEPVQAKGGRIGCHHEGLGLYGCHDWADWREHVAPIIADRIACDPQRAIDALKNHQPTKVTT